MFQEPYKTIILRDEITGLDFSVDYFISEHQSVISESIRAVTYGVATQMFRAGKCDLARADGICTTRKEAEEFVERLARHGVTPTTFLEIVDDSFSPPVRREQRDVIAPFTRV